MPYDEKLAERIRRILSPQPRLTERKMFGGIGFMLAGNLCCGVLHEDLILRLGTDQAEAALAERRARPFDLTGRPMAGWVIVGPEGSRDDGDLNRWLTRAAAFVSTLPTK